MLTPTYLQNCPDDIVELYAKLDESITRDVVRRLLKTGKITESAKWQAEMAQQSGMLYDDVMQRVTDISGLSETTVKAAFEDAAVESVAFDNSVYEAAGLSPKPLNMSPAAVNVLKAGLSKTNGLIKNLTNTTALQAQDAYINACTLAEMQITSGAFDYNTAIKHAVDDAIEQGATIRYPPKPGQALGHVDTLETAVRRSVMTGVSQTAGEISEGYADDMGCDLMEITAHGGARPDHAKWQGQIVSRSGKPGYWSLDGIGYKTGAGFKGYNCRHDWYPYFEGISLRAYTDDELKAINDKTVEYNGKVYSQSDAEQMQRSMERSVRKSKQKLAGYDEARKTAPTDKLKDEFDTDFYAESQKLKAKKNAYADFSDKTGLPTDTARLQTRGYNRSVSGKAVAAAKKDVSAAPNKPVIRKGYTAKQLESMTDAELKKHLSSLSAEWYPQSGISFGDTPINEAIDSLMKQPRSRTSMTKDIKAMQGKLKTVPAKKVVPKVPAKPLQPPAKVKPNISRPAKQAVNKSYTGKELGSMSEAQLKNRLSLLAAEYYPKSGISFGGTPISEAIDSLMKQKRSKASMIKDIMAMQKKLK